jgi:pimeloyl-[acyl-carrier protein] methyl ester esterase
VSQSELLVLPGWATGDAIFGPLLARWDGKATVADWGAAREADDLPRLALAAAEQLRGSFTLLGWSLGAMVALELAPQLLARLDGLLLLAPCLRFTEGWPVRVLDRMRRRCRTDTKAVLDAFAPSLLSTSEVAEPRLGALPLRRDLPAAALLAGLDYLAGRDLAVPSLGVLGILDVRVLHGSEDVVVPPGLSVALSERLGAERLDLAGAGHAPHLTRPDEVAQFLFHSRRWAHGACTEAHGALEGAP